MIKGKKVIVSDGNTEKALRKFKKIVTDSGLLRELKEREFYMKPTTRRKMAKSLAKKRWNRYLSDQSLPVKQY